MRGIVIVLILGGVLVAGLVTKSMLRSDTTAVLHAMPAPAGANTPQAQSVHAATKQLEQRLQKQAAKDVEASEKALKEFDGN